ncbi:MAG: hypothetical protein DWI21_05230 [Planctomycetota bacterium]|nr:MAG: hypothetical protein DWI21_05230 [Planctomycetota bacterium]
MWTPASANGCAEGAIFKRVGSLSKVFVEKRNAPICLHSGRTSVSSDNTDRCVLQRGNALLEKAGCAIGHVPNVGPAVGLYSDLLLHDMGPHLSDPLPRTGLGGGGFC